MAARTWFVIVALCGVVAAASWGYAQQRGTPTVTAQDFVEIQQLLWRNHQGFDFASRDNADMWVSTFTPDAELNSPGRAVVGEEAIRQLALDYFKDDPQRRIRHWTSTFLVTPTPEGANADRVLDDHDVKRRRARSGSAEPADTRARWSRPTMVGA